VQIGDLIYRAAQRFGDAPAITCGERTLTFRDFDTATDKLGNALLDSGLRPGDRVGVLMPNGIDGLLAYYALAKSGLVRVSLNVRDTPQDHDFRLRDADCRALITDRTSSSGTEFTIGQEDLTRMLSDGRNGRCDIARDPEEPYRLGYTGGTTGSPKAVILSSRSEHSEIANYLLDLVPDIRQGDVMLHAAPVTHASGSFFLPHLIRGAHNIVLSTFDADSYLEELERCKATATFLVPTMLAMILDHPGVEQVSTAGLRHLCYGASPIAPSVAERTQHIFGRVLAQTYGQAEAPMTISLLRPDEHDRVGSAGRPYTMVEVRIFDEGDREVPRGESGEVAVRGQILMSGYWNRPEETARTMRGGWLHTGDIGRLDDEGFLYLLDRRHDVIISGGFNVYPREIEDVLLSHPHVREAAVIGVADERWGEVVQAVVSLRAPVEEHELLEWVRPRLAGYKRPRAFHFSPDLPKSSAGKILRRTVRDELASAVVPDTHESVNQFSTKELTKMETNVSVLHGLAVKKAGTAEQVATVVGQDVGLVQQALDTAAASGEVIVANGTYMPTPAGRAKLAAAYPVAYVEVRRDKDFIAAADRFEVMNKKLLNVLTRWQTVAHAGTTSPNDHGDPVYDTKIINELGEIHDKCEPVLSNLSAKLPRYESYADRLATSYDKALGGKFDFVSGVRVDSYHLVWHELHEDLLRVLGRTRQE